MKDSFGVYIHWPFCVSKCPYCDFNSHVRETIDLPAWKNALKADLDRFITATQGRPVHSIFFGGGTPSLMPPDLVASLINHIQKNWSFVQDIEISLEANPNSSESSNFQAFAAAGINRVSIGVQSFNDFSLRFLKRQHTGREAHQAIELAQKYFPRYSFDLIYTLPEQTLSAWEQELTTALDVAGTHLSLYQLTIEEGTPFFLQHQKKSFHMPSNDLSHDFYTLTTEVLNRKRFHAYEVSNYAKNHHICAHNLGYWTYADYIGVGPGAHSRLTHKGKKVAQRKHRSPEHWLAQKEKSIQETLLSEEEVFQEILMMGLRLYHQGVSKKTLTDYAARLTREKILPQKLNALKAEKLLTETEAAYILTPSGMLRLNSILNYLYQ